MPDGPAEDMGGKDFMAFSTIGDKTSTERTFAEVATGCYEGEPL